VIPTPIQPTFPVVLDPDEAADLTHLLDLIEDWLSRIDDDTHADLADYLDGAGNGPLTATGLIATLQQTTLALHHRLKQANR
jgi:hypothetical protein